MNINNKLKYIVNDIIKKDFTVIINLMVLILPLIFVISCSTEVETKRVKRQIITPSIQMPDVIQIQSKYIAVNKDKKNASIGAIISRGNQVTKTYKNNKDELIYISSNPKVATVDSIGNVTYVSDGFTVITIKSNDINIQEKRIVVNTNSKKVIENELEKPKQVVLDYGTVISLYLDSRKTFKSYARIIPSSVKLNKLNYFSLNEKVATVSEIGDITGHNPGNTEILVVSDVDPDVYSFIYISVTNSKPATAEDSQIYDLPVGAKPLSFDDPFSLISKYYIINYKIDNGKPKKPDLNDNFRVNVKLDNLNDGIVNIIMYIKLKGKEVSLDLPQKIDLSNLNTEIPRIFTDLGARIDSEYGLIFELSPDIYKRVAEFGLVPLGKVLTLKLQKESDLELGNSAPLGEDIVFNPNAEKPIIKVPPIQFPENPFSLIAIYNITSFVKDGVEKIPSSYSEFRVNAALGTDIVIEMFLKLEGKIYSFKIPVILEGSDLNNSISNIFNKLGATVLDDHNVKFDLKAETYPMLVDAGFIEENRSLILNMKKLEELKPLEGLGDVEDNNLDVEIAPDSKPNKITSIRFNREYYTPQKTGDSIDLGVVIEPRSMSNSKLTWSATIPDAVEIDGLKGKVTFLKNVDNIITAKSSDNDVQAVLNVKKLDRPIGFELDVKRLILYQGADSVYPIEYKIYPEFLTDYTQKPTFKVITKNFGGKIIESNGYSSTNQVISIEDGTGKINVLGLGTAEVVANLDGIESRMTVEVKKITNEPKITNIKLNNEKGIYPINSTFYIKQANIQYTPSNAPIKNFKLEGCNQNVKFGLNGKVTTIAPGHCIIKVIPIHKEGEIFAELDVTIDNFPSDIRFEKSHVGIKFGDNHEKQSKVVLLGNPTNKNLKITTDNPNLIEIIHNTTGEKGNTYFTDADKNIFIKYRIKDKAKGDGRIIFKSENGLEKSFKVSTYTPVDFNDIKTLEGTYEIQDFDQQSIVFIGGVNVSTKPNGGVERLLGQYVITLDGNKVLLKSKMQMDSTGLFNYGGPQAETAYRGLFTTTIFTPATYDKGGFGNIGTNNSAKFDYDKSTERIQLYQEWIEMSIATIKVTSFIKKLSDTPIEVDFNKLMFSRSHHDSEERDADYLRKGFYDKSKPDHEPDLDEGVLPHIKK